MIHSKKHQQSSLIVILLLSLASRAVQSSYLIAQHQHLQQQQQQQLLSQQQQQQQQQDPLAGSQAPSIIPFSFNQNVQENQRAMVMCTTSSGETPVAYTWLKDGQLLTASLAQARRIAMKLDQDASTLKITSVRLDHAGNYTCLAKNRAGSQSHSAQLVVHGEPRWLKEPQHEPIVATRGQTVVIDCQTTGWPRPQQSWHIKTHLQSDFEQLAVTSMGRISVASDGSLVIKNADKSDEANYLCKSTNGIGKGLSWSTSLKVTVPAHFEASQRQQTIIVRKQTQVQLRCDAYGDQPITIEWFRNNKPLGGGGGAGAGGASGGNSLVADPASLGAHHNLLVEPRYSMHGNNNPLRNGLISQLLIKQTQRQDNAVFECYTKNPYGRDKLAIELVVQEEPDNIQEIQATQLNSRSVTLMWTEPYDGRSSITSYMFQYKKVQDLAAGATSASAVVAQSAMGADGFDGFMLDTQGDQPLASSSSGAARQHHLLQPATTGAHDDDWQQALRIMLPVQVNSSQPGNVRSITIEKLEPSSRYVIRALAVNAVGQSKFSQPMEFSTDEEAPEIGPVNIRAQAINSTSIQVSWDEIPKSKQLGRIHGYYIGYRVANNNSAAANFLYKPYMINDMVIQQQQQQQQQVSGNANPNVNNNNNNNAPAVQRLETVLHELKRDTVYEITVIAFNSRGSGPSSDFVVCKTIEMEAPKPVKLQIRKESNESIFIEWSRDPSDQNPVDDYVLYQEKNSASQEWLQLRLPGNQTQHKAPGLKCGTRYQFYIIAHNKVGKSQPSEVVGASTSGALPVVPSKLQLIKLVNSTCLMVNLNSFQDNGCRIKTFTVRYRVEKTDTSPLAASASIAASSSASSGSSTSTGPTATTLTGSNGVAAIHQELTAAASAAAASTSLGGPLKAHSMISQAAGSVGMGVGGGGGGPSGGSSGGSSLATPSEWITIRPRSSLKHHQRSEEDRMEYLCDLSPTGEYTIHVAATNDVGRSEIEYTVLMSSDELRQSAWKDALEFAGSLTNVFVYIPSMIVFLLAGLLVSLVGLILYTTAIKYYQKFIIMQNQMRASRRAKADKRRRQKLTAAANQSQKQLDWWADEYEEGEADLEDDRGDGDDDDNDDMAGIGCGGSHSSGGPLDDDGDDEAGSSGGSSGSQAAVMQQHHSQRHQHRPRHPGQSRHSHSLHHHSQQQQQQQRGRQQQQHHHRQFSRSSCVTNAAGHYLSNIANSAFDTSSIDSPCNKFRTGTGSTCLSTASTDSIHGRFQCLSSKQYVKMNEYTMLPAQNLTPIANDIYGVTTAAAAGPQAAPSQSSASPMSNSNSLYYSTLRRTTNMQTYLPQQQQQQQHIDRRHSQNVTDIYGYYMPPTQAAQQAAADEVANSIFVPPQQIIYSAPNIRRQPPPGTFI